MAHCNFPEWRYIDHFWTMTLTFSNPSRRNCLRSYVNDAEQYITGPFTFHFANISFPRWILSYVTLISNSYCFVVHDIDTHLVRCRVCTLAIYICWFMTSWRVFVVMQCTQNISLQRRVVSTFWQNGHMFYGLFCLPCKDENLGVHCH